MLGGRAVLMMDHGKSYDKPQQSPYNRVEKKRTGTYSTYNVSQKIPLMFCDILTKLRHIKRDHTVHIICSKCLPLAKRTLGGRTTASQLEIYIIKGDMFICLFVCCRWPAERLGRSRPNLA